MGKPFHHLSHNKRDVGGLHQCSRCCKWKSADEFYRNKHRGGALGYWCRGCFREYQTGWRNGIRERRKSLDLSRDRENRILDLWCLWGTKEYIAAEMDMAVSTVDYYINRARRWGDPRVNRQVRDRTILKADTRRKQISRLFAEGMTSSQIAGQLGISERLVQIRLSEAEK